MEKVRLNLYVDDEVVGDARETGLNISRFLEQKLAEHARATRRQQWLDESREAMRACNERGERDGPWNRDLVNF